MIYKEYEHGDSAPCSWFHHLIYMVTRLESILFQCLYTVSHIIFCLLLKATNWKFDVALFNRLIITQ